MDYTLENGTLDVRHLSSWVSNVEHFSGAGPTGFLRIMTKTGDVYEIHGAPPALAGKIGDAIESTEEVQGTDSDPDLSVGQMVNKIFGSKYDVIKRTEEEL